MADWLGKVLAVLGTICVSYGVYSVVNTGTVCHLPSNSTVSQAAGTDIRKMGK